MTTANAIGWFATALMVWGSVDIAHKKVRGLWLMLVANFFWAGSGWLADLSSLVAVSILMAILDGYGIWKWREADEVAKAVRGNLP